LLKAELVAAVGRQLVHGLKAEPVVEAVAAKPGIVAGPRQIPVEGRANSLLNENPF
jgi:hypothetical protein